jgi:hypothetical protein
MESFLNDQIIPKGETTILFRSNQAGPISPGVLSDRLLNLLPFPGFTFDTASSRGLCT